MGWVGRVWLYESSWINDRVGCSSIRGHGTCWRRLLGDMSYGCKRLTYRSTALMHLDDHVHRNNSKALPLPFVHLPHSSDREGVAGRHNEWRHDEKPQRDERDAAMSPRRDKASHRLLHRPCRGRLLRLDANGRSSSSRRGACRLSISTHGAPQ